MLLNKFRIQNFEGIDDSGWIESDSITTITGSNENEKMNILKALWFINDSCESKNINKLLKKQYGEEDKMFISVRYKISPGIIKKISKITKVDKAYIKDTIEIVKHSSGKYIICEFIKEKELINNILNKWINKNDDKLNKRILKITKKYKKNINESKTFANNIIQKKIKNFFVDLNKLKTTEDEDILIEILKNKIDSSFVFDKENQDIKDIIISNMPKLIFYTEVDSNDKISVNKTIFNLDEAHSHIENGIYKKDDKNVILLMHNFEQNCMLIEDLDLIDYFKEKLGDIQVIHTTSSPFLLNKRNNDKWIINADKGFKKECVKRDKSYKIHGIAMTIGIFIWIVYTIFLFYKTFTERNIYYSKGAWIIYIKEIWKTLEEIVIKEFHLLLIMIILLVIFVLIKDKIEKKANGNKISEIISGLITGQLITPILLITKIVPLLLMIVIIITSSLGTLFISVKIFPYVAKTFISFLVIALDSINDIGVGINISEMLLSNEEFTWYIILIITFAFLPYINEITIKLTTYIYGFISKPLTESSIKIIKKLVNVNSIRLAIYMGAFFLSVVTFILEIEDVNIIKESMLSFIILDVIINGIYNHINDINKRKTKIRRLEIINLIKNAFTDNFMDKNKYEVRKIVYDMENNKKQSFYFGKVSKKSILSKWKIKQVTSDIEYLEGFFWRYNRLKNTSIMLKKDYVVLLKDIQEIIEYYERMIISS